MKILALAKVLILGAALALTSTVACAQTYPDHAITLIIPFPAGGGTDLIGRQLAAEMEVLLGQPVVVENIGGAAGTVGGARAARAKPDGYTLLLAADQVAATGALKEVTYDGTKDLVPIAAVSLNYMSLISGPALEAEDFQRAVAEMKANPGNLEFGTPGIMSSPHLAAEIFQSRAGVELLHVPYQGGGPAMTDAIAGVIPLVFSTVGQAVGQIKGGQLRMLITFSEERLPMTPDIPTANELGLQDLVLSSFTGIFVPADTPGDIVARLQETVAAVVEDPKFQAKLGDIGVLPAPDTGTDYLRELVSVTDTNMRSAFGNGASSK